MSLWIVVGGEDAMDCWRACRIAGKGGPTVVVLGFWMGMWWIELGEGRGRRFARSKEWQKGFSSGDGTADDTDDEGPRLGTGAPVYSKNQRYIHRHRDLFQGNRICELEKIQWGQETNLY